MYILLIMTRILKNTEYLQWMATEATSTEWETDLYPTEDWVVGSVGNPWADSADRDWRLDAGRHVMPDDLYPSKTRQILWDKLP